MHRILHNSRGQGFEYEDFKKRFFEICNKHKSEARAMAFAFIVYKKENPEIIKILEDQDYWNALDAISGKFITVFSIKHKIKRKLKARSSIFGQGLSGMGMMPEPMSGSISINSFSGIDDTTEDLLADLFHLNRNFPTPSILFFQVEDEKIIDQFFINIIESKIEETFLELKSYINKTVQSLQFVTQKNRQNSKEVFNLLKTDLKHTSLLNKIGKKIPTGKTILQFVTALNS